MSRPLVMAHRGGAGFRVENTLAAFAHAIRLGCDGAELDVHLTRDGQVVVHHNARLNHRYTRDASGQWLRERDELALNSLTLAELRSYRVGVPNPRTDFSEKYPSLVAEEGGIPTLREVIQLVRERSSTFRLLIEFKADVLSDSDRAWSGLLEAVLEVIDQERFLERCSFCSFDWRALAEVKRRHPGCETWMTTHPFGWLSSDRVNKKTLTGSSARLARLRSAWASGELPWLAGHLPTDLDHFPEAAREAGGDFWFAYYGDLKPHHVTIARQAGIKVAVWTNNEREPGALNDVLAAKVDALCVDYPSSVALE